MNQVYIVVAEEGDCDHCSCEKNGLDIIEVFEREIDAENYIKTEASKEYGRDLFYLTWLVK